jgi:putative membrane protein
MDRRASFLFVGAGLAATAGRLLVTPAAAQQSSRPTSSTAANVLPEQVRAMALGGMAFALATSQVALQRAENASVRTFAQLEAEEQETFAAARQMAGLAPPNPAMMDGQKQQMLQQLQGASGREFDRAYLQGQITGHEELLQLHMAMARASTDREERLLGMVGVPAIKTHLVMLQSIQQMMRS